MGPSSLKIRSSQISDFFKFYAAFKVAPRWGYFERVSDSSKFLINCRVLVQRRDLFACLEEFEKGTDKKSCKNGKYSRLFEYF